MKPLRPLHQTISFFKMKVFNHLRELSSVRGPLVIAAGVFDGLHLGHQAVLQGARNAAQAAGGTAVALTFDPHPSKILRPEKPVRLLASTRHKLRLMEESGLEAVLVLPFDKAFAAVEAEDFLRHLASCAPQLSQVCVGQGWRFGHERRGDAELLRWMGQELGFKTSEVESVQMDGTTVSSTRIRKLVELGALSDACRLLGRNYSIFGTVVRGDGLGRQLGFPTANVSAPNEQFPPDGVYSVRVRTVRAVWTGVANIGRRPTLKAAGERVFEIHIVGFDGDLYGQELEAEFLRFLRPEEKFPGVAALREQIAKDVQSVIQETGGFSAPDLRAGDA